MSHLRAWWRSSANSLKLMLPCVESPGASSTQLLPFPSSQNPAPESNRTAILGVPQCKPSQLWMYLVLAASATGKMVLFCCPALPHTLIHLRYPDSKVSRMASLCILQTCCTSDQPGAQGWTLNLWFLPYHLKEKCLPENHSPAWGMKESTQTHAMCAAGKLGRRYRHPTSPQAETSWEKEQIKLTHTSLTTLIAFIATTLPYGCGLPPLHPDATALPTVSPWGSPQLSTLLLALLSLCQAARATAAILQASCRPPPAPPVLPAATPPRGCLFTSTLHQPSHFQTLPSPAAPLCSRAQPLGRRL